MHTHTDTQFHLKFGLLYSIDSHMKSLEVEVIDLGNNLRSLEVSETQASEREAQYTNKLNEMSQRYREVSRTRE